MDSKTKAQIELLASWIDECDATTRGGAVFLGGAGVSTESGIPDFRGAGGLYSRDYGFPPEQILSRSFFERDPQCFFDFYCGHMLYSNAMPNAAHTTLAALERAGKLTAIITQNVDGLHQTAGSKNVYELHGSTRTNTCLACAKQYGLFDMLERCASSLGSVPRCDCGGVIKPDVVLYEERLPADALYGALDAIEAAEVLIVAGTSLSVYPASSLINHFSGRHLAIVNLSPTPQDSKADICIRAKVGEVFELMSRILNTDDNRLNS